MLLILYSEYVSAQKHPFRFAFISDTHIGSPNGGAEEDLRRTVADINSLPDISFVVITGDITELGMNRELILAKRILDSLHVKYYIIPGNHDTGWSESGGLAFTEIFGNDRFFFNYAGIHFIGCASGPYVRMSDGHVPRNAMNWMKEKLNEIPTKEPVIFLNHYPLDNGMDNWYEVIDLLKTKNTILALCGHGHNNRKVSAEGIPSVMGRSNLRAKAVEGGYNLVDVRVDSIVFTERKPVSRSEAEWIAVKNEKHTYASDTSYSRPDFSMNLSDDAHPVWTYNSSANVISTPAVLKNLVVFGNQNGQVEAIDLASGKRKWTYATNGPIFSSPAVSNELIVLGSSDKFIYCIDIKGKLRWKVRRNGPVLGSPFIENGVVYIGGSDHSFGAYNLQTGASLWNFSGLEGPVVSRPVISGNKVLFGAWDKNLYALDKESGKFLWKWSNGSPVINYSPAACIPVVHLGVVYIAAPDRFLTAIDINTGSTLWRTNEAAVRESIGISNDGLLIYGKTMQDTVVAFYTGTNIPKAVWKVNAGFGYEHAPSMLIESGTDVVFGTRNGVVYAINRETQQVHWKYKIDNSMVNTVNVLNEKQIIASTMDGKVCLLSVR